MDRVVGLNVRLFGATHLSNPMPTRFESAVAALLLWIHKRHRAKIVFFPFYQDRAGGDVRALSRVLEALQGDRPAVDVLRLPSAASLLERLRECDAFIGVRYHSVVAAIRSGVPVLGIDYGRKTRRLMTENGLGRFVLPVEEVSAERLIDLWESLILQGDALKSQLAALNVRQREMALRHFDLIAEVLSGRSATGRAKASL